MTTRLTPVRIAERELSRLVEREDRLVAQLEANRAEQERWQSVLAALDGVGSHQEAAS